ncbi:MAG: hypothetical protein K5829_00250 [Treponema sp.]|nr:hypothetical protein [Treponema sp.]
MKKIVGIIGAALLASSIFAVDFSAGVRLDGSLFNYTASKNAGSTITALKERHDNEFYHAPIAFAVSGDKAGGTLKLTDQAGDAVKTGAWSIWFKPLDMVKITVGANDFALNQEHIGWCNSESHLETTGYAVNFALDAFQMNLILNPGNDTPWFKKAGTADADIKELAATFGYSADFGTINAFFDTAASFANYRFALGYNAGSLLPVNLWVNVIGYAADKFKEFKAIRGEVDVATNFGSIGWELFVAGGYNMKSMDGFNDNFGGSESWHVGYAKKAEAPFCGFYTKFSIPVNALGVYVELKSPDVLADDKNFEIKPGFTVNVGACAINLALDAKLDLVSEKDKLDDFGRKQGGADATKVTIDIPVEFKVNF